ncbi:mCG1050987 [Mus musculus]|nr:mCG1050987 [Mus musculus]
MFKSQVWLACCSVNQQDASDSHPLCWLPRIARHIPTVPHSLLSRTGSGGAWKAANTLGWLRTQSHKCLAYSRVSGFTSEGESDLHL